MESQVQTGIASVPNLLRMGFERLGRMSRNAMKLRRSRNLHLCETLSLGNRGYLAVVGYQEQRFLVGGTNNSIALLARLSARPACGEEPTEESENSDK